LRMHGNPLNREEIARLIAGADPLVEDYVALEPQLQPNGFDLTVQEVARFAASGQLGASDADRVVSSLAPLDFDADGWLSLEPGPYLITFNEVVNLPPDLMALGRPRSSLLRSGVALHTAVWDAGYRGRSQSLLTVQHPGGFRLQRNARLAQLVFFRLATPPEQGYRGSYQGEGL
jgi:dUTP pyrophosphatase